jgi:hypothetical protein
MTRRTTWMALVLAAAAVPVARTGQSAAAEPVGGLTSVRGQPAAHAPVQAVGTVRGRVTQAVSMQPLGGVFVSLLDAGGARSAAVLSNPDGWFILRPSRPGTYSLRLELIGHATHHTESFDVHDAAVALDPVALQQSVITLASIEVAAADGRCRIPRDAGTETYRVWEEARKALTVAAWAEREAGIPYQIVQYELARDLTSNALRVDQAHLRSITSRVGRSTFVGASAEDLAENGYIRPANHGFTYYGLDAATMLSDEFLRNYCLRVRFGRGDDLVGLAFEPVRGGKSDVTGTLWLDRETLHIRLLEYRYTRHPHLGDVPLDLFGGRVEFEQLPNGAVIVTRWYIRMPQQGPPLASRLPPISSVRTTSDWRMAGLMIREEGGAVRFLGAGEPPTGEGGDAVIAGIVHDSTRQRPLAGATVFLHGTTHRAVTDRQGRFRMRGLPHGDYQIGFFHAYTDSLALAITTQPVSTDRDVVLHVPTASGCAPDPGADPEIPTSHVIGFVLDGRGEPVAGAAVTAAFGPPPRWTWRDAVAGIPRGRRDQITRRSDADGRYLICHLPAAWPIQLQAERGRSVQVTTSQDGIVRQDLVVR